MSNFIETFDEHRYSRQSYAIGKDAQVRLSESHILVIGYNSLSQEIIRNMALIGISKIDIYTDEKMINKNINTTGLYYQIIDNMIPLEKLQKLNPTIKINCVNIMNNNEIDEKIINQYNSIILTNSTFDNAKYINNYSHKNDIPFIMCGTYGLMGYIFNDLGEQFIVNDIDGEQLEPLILESIDNKILKFKDEHKLSQNDIIVITNTDGIEIELKVLKKKSPLIIELVENNYQNKKDYCKIIKKKNSKIFNYKSIENNIVDPIYTISDWSVGMKRSVLLHKLHIALNEYINELNELPSSWSLNDFDIFYSKYFNKSNENLSETDIILLKKFCYTLKGDILPICSIIGGIVSHEILKILTHKYNPIQQWYYMDYLDLILDTEINSNYDYENFKTKDKYNGLVNVFGKRFLETIQNTVPFVIGSGAIGCELIKNLGMIGVKKVYLTDPDHIEKSNLSRQFLFNDEDIRQSKSETVSKKIKLMNPDIEIIGLKYKMCHDTENYFNKEFHKNIDIYLNALDNVDARIYMDKMAMKYSKPLIDSGTMGSKGNVQVIIPHLTESYGSSTDPEEKTGIPICTIKAFPYKPEHTIQWARELFESEFNLIPNIINKYKNINELEKINDLEASQLLKQLYKYIQFSLTPQFYDLLLGTIYKENFYDNIKEIIDKYSKEEHKEELADKKLPNYLNNNIEHFNQFVKYGYNLLNQMFKTNIQFDIKHMNSYQIFNYNLNELKSEHIIEIVKPIINNFSTIHLNPIEFEKDDDELEHVQWISVCSNLRNYQYSIPQTDLWNVRKIAGNIIPALITTTSITSGFQILEFIRICKLYEQNKYITQENKKDIELYKNRFINIDTNYCDGVNPLPSSNYKLKNGNNISLWTIFKTSFINTKQIINQIETETNEKIEFMMQENITIYDGNDIFINQIDIHNKIIILLGDIEMEFPLIYTPN